MVSILLGTQLAIVLICLGVLLLFHHGFKHMHDPPDALVNQESCEVCCFFQRSDIFNHETWILICFTNALMILLILYL